MSSNAVKKMSLLAAIFVNLNVMIGTGIFINTYDLSSTLGAAGFLLYPLVGIIMLPLIAVIGQLIKEYPTGGLYAFAQHYSAYLGFLSCWSYFFGKLASACVMLSVATTMLQQLITPLKTIDPMVISLTILACFTALNLQNMKLGIMIQSFFLTAKSIPIIFGIIAGIYLFDISAISIDASIWQGIAINIPLVLYCLAGFETACSLSRNIENPTVNGPKAVYYSFTIIMLLYGLFQGCMYLATYQNLHTITSFDMVFPTIAAQYFTTPAIAQSISIIVCFAICASALGGAYGILFSNSWNLYTLAEHGHTFAASTVLQLNRHQTPWIAVIIESITCALFIICNQGSLLPLRRTAALGIVIAYSISTFAYCIAHKNFKNHTTSRWIGYAAGSTCLLFFASCIISFIETGLAPLALFLTILCVGSIMFFITQLHKKSNTTLYK